MEGTEANPLAGGVAARIALCMVFIPPVTPASEIDGRTVNAPAEPVKLPRVKTGPLLEEAVIALDGRDDATTEIPAIFLAATALALWPAIPETAVLLPEIVGAKEEDPTPLVPVTVAAKLDPLAEPLALRSSVLSIV